MSTLFRDATLVELDPPSVRQGDLRQADGRITSVGRNLTLESDDEVVDCGGAVLMPGLVNGHTHLYSALAAGMPAPPRQPKNFQEILELIWWRLDRAHNLASVTASGAIGALAALRCGTTTLIDHHASPNSISGSLTALETGIAKVGCRGVLCYEVTDRNCVGEASAGLFETALYATELSGKKDHRFAAMVGAHASFTLAEKSLVGCVELARDLDLGVHIHVAEDPCDERITRENFGCGLMERFERVGLLQVSGSIFGHGTHLSADDFARLGDYAGQLHLAHNPSSNMNNGVGYTPVAKATTPVVLGTDGIGADMWREARVAEFKSHDAQTALPFGKSLSFLAESARLASRALGITVGSLEVGAAADLVITNYRPATPLTSDNLAGHFLFAMGPEFVRDVMIDGRWCLRGGEVVSCDEVALRSEAVTQARELWSRMV
ncbi:amidohydrolase family protein [Bythopirellula polymerisocia]|uniref:5-methylthioadenosine/S-adenosylhomocysteine deaminase n=1 Tax=Bythopirellula polymerisocia TaxID=2528003 RepID=A0A5C6CHB3_9BACT|nr:amidohydrolase family protein [Bythopirellula polymerisocia]TWU22661.1 5-methylthioadenosine/S-adenosylhomocysteine deaminase [Bythopirellula polymerisocia]